MSQDAETIPTPEPRPHTPEGELLEAQEKNDNLGAKIDAAEEEIAKRPAAPVIGGIVGD